MSRSSLPCPLRGGTKCQKQESWMLCCLQERWMLTDANFSGQRSSMQGQQRPLSFLERRQASQEFNPHLTYDGGVPLRSPAGLRVNTYTVAYGRGSSPTPYSPPSAETVSLRVNTRSCAYGRGSSPAPYSPPSAETAVGGGEGLTLTCLWEGADLSIQALSTCSTAAKQVSLPPNTSKKRGVFFCQQIWAQEASVCAAKLIQKAQTNICRYSLTKWRPSPPIFRRKKGGGHTTSQIALPAWFLNFLE